MEKSITKEMLNSIDINKVTNEIEKHLSEKITDNTNSSKKTDSVTTMDTTEKTEKTKKTEKSKKSKQSRANTQSNTQTDTDSITFSSKSNSKICDSMCIHTTHVKGHGIVFSSIISMLVMMAMHLIVEKG